MEFVEKEKKEALKMLLKSPLERGLRGVSFVRGAHWIRYISEREKLNQSGYSSDVGGYG